MILMKETDFGMIAISKNVFAEIVEAALNQPGCAGVIWPTARGGNLLDRVLHFTDPEVMKSIRVYSEEGTVKIEFSVIMKFGASIRAVTRKVSDYICERVREFLPEEPIQITVDIAGVRSKQVARRNTKTVYRYESDR